MKRGPSCPFPERILNIRAAHGRYIFPLCTDSRPGLPDSRTAAHGFPMYFLYSGITLGCATLASGLHFVSVLRQKSRERVHTQ